MEYTIMQLMDEANYNHEAGNTGWIYEWTDKWLLPNERIMTVEQLKETKNDMPSLHTYDNITPQMIASKNNVENHLDNLIEVKTQNYERGMAA